MGSQVIKYSDESKKLTENAFIWDAHTFNGWNTESDGTEIRSAMRVKFPLV